MAKIRSESMASAKKAMKSFGKHGFGAIPTRYVIVFLSAFINMISYTMRTNFNVTIIAMVNETNNGENSEINNNTCYVPPNDDTSDTNDNLNRGEFDWSPSLQGVVLGGYYYGYIVTSINAGQLADWIGPRYICGFSILIASILTLLTPVCAYWSVYATIVLRILIGLVQGVLTPSLYTLLAYWVPQQERSTALALIAVGGNIGAVLTMPLSGYLSGLDVIGGWPLVFYVLGSAGCCTFFLWMYSIYNNPSEHPRIKAKEMIFIQANASVTVMSSNKKKKTFIPWGAILTSPRFWVVASTKFCAYWGNLVIMTKLPAYLSMILHFPIEKNGIINAFVYVSLSTGLIAFGYLSDYIERKKLLSRTVSRKVFEAIALIGTGILSGLIPVVGCNQSAVIALLLCSMVIFGFTSGGDSPIVVDIAPDYSGTVYGISNCIASLPGFLAPLAIGLILDSNPVMLVILWSDTRAALSLSDPMKSWNIVFYFSSGMYILGALIFCLFISAKPEAWGRARQGTVRSTFDCVSVRGTIVVNEAKSCSCDSTCSCNHKVEEEIDRNVYVNREKPERKSTINSVKFAIDINDHQ